MRFRVAFGLFGLSENSSFPSTLRAWFAFAHSSPYRKSNRKDQKLTVPHPIPPRVGEGTTDTPSPTWGSQGWGVSRKGFFLFVILNSGAMRNVIQNPLHPLPIRHSGLRAGVRYEFRGF